MSTFYVTLHLREQDDGSIKVMALSQSFREKTLTPEQLAWVFRKLARAIESEEADQCTT